MTIQRALLWGICLILAVVALSQLLSLWWLQTTIAARKSPNKAASSVKLFLARTAEKIQLNTKVITLDDKNTAEPASAPDNTPTLGQPTHQAIPQPR